MHRTYTTADPNITEYDNTVLKNPAFWPKISYKTSLTMPSLYPVIKYSI